MPQFDRGKVRSILDHYNSKTTGAADFPLQNLLQQIRMKQEGRVYYFSCECTQNYCFRLFISLS